MGIDASGMRSLSRDLRAAGEKAGPLVSLVVRKTALDTERDAKTLAPVDTGNLRSSIGTDVTDTGSSVAAEIGPTADYGLFQEVGTSRMAAQPYMGPALDRNGPLMEAAFDQIIDRMLP